MSYCYLRQSNMKNTQKNTAVSQYDLIVVPGMKFATNWQLQKDLKKRLHYAAELHAQNPGSRILVCGKWSIWYDWLSITPPVTEAQAMKRYLVESGVRSRDILIENRSKDTVGNAYYTKRILSKRPEIKNLTVLCAEQHLERVKFLFDTFFGDQYYICYETLEAPNFDLDVTGKEQACFEEQKDLLRHVRPGHEQDFRHYLYKCAYYSRQAKAVAEKRLAY
jgi:uncharacterized SAM-binding protein YcdF (DUF218 family)